MIRALFRQGVKGYRQTSEFCKPFLDECGFFLKCTGLYFFLIFGVLYWAGYGLFWMLVFSGVLLASFSPFENPLFSRYVVQLALYGWPIMLLTAYLLRNRFRAAFHQVDKKS